MKIEASSWSRVRTEPASGCEKVRARRALPAFVAGAVHDDGAFSNKTDSRIMSRFGTNRAAVRPASGFAAQVLGQVLGGDRPDARDVNAAYTHAAETALPPCVIPLFRV